jgi:hypothetical protein
MPDASLNDSSAFPDFAGSIASAKGNKIVISNLCMWVSADGFTLPQSPEVYQYSEIILPLATQTTLPDSLFYKPELVSQEVYGTPDLWWLILWVNGMSSVYEFCTENILMLPPDALDTLNDLIDGSSASVAASRLSPTPVPQCTLTTIVL